MRVPRDTGPQRRATAEDRRREIIDAAIPLFAARGFRSTGVIGLAKEVGLTHGGLLYHFGTKEALLYAVIGERLKRQQGTYLDVFEPGGRAAIERLPQIGHQLIEDRTLARLYTVLLAESFDSEDPLHDMFMERYRLSMTVLTWVVQTGIERGEFRPDADPRSIAGEILSFSIGLQTRWLLEPAAVDPVAEYTAYSRGLLDRLEPPAHVGAPPYDPPTRLD